MLLGPSYLFPLLRPVMLRLPDLHISSKTQLFFGTAACVGVIGVILRAFLRKSDSRLPLPPSPPTWRLRGHFLPPNNASLTVAEWIDEYGPLITIRSGLQNIVIIGRHKAAVDIMEKQGVLLADRPHVAAGEILTRGLALALSHAGDRFRRKRRALHTHLQPKSAEAYQPLQMSHAKNVVLNILDDPHNFQNHAGTYAAATIMKVAYGKTTSTSATDPEIREARQLIRRFRTLLHPGAYWVESIPWLRYLPGYAPELKDEFERTMRLYTEQLNRVKLQIQSNVDTGPSFARYMIENEHLYDLTETEMAYLAGTFFAAGTETVRHLSFLPNLYTEMRYQTAVAICTVLMAAACISLKNKLKSRPSLMQSSEGSEHRPSLTNNLCPRLEAFISEALRWRPLTPGGLPHRTTRDVGLGKLLLFQLVLQSAATTEVYPEPDAFMPQRWIGDEGRLRDDLTFFVYGFGRRVCPGQHLANRSVFINSLLILWAFQLSLDLTKPQDDMGFMNAAIPNVPCAIKFKTRVPEVELRRMMQNYAESS
ncbi:cytochrome P450 [Suillus lakei]|nr:cytochrome P450 [Suillus lakei]